MEKLPEEYYVKCNSNWENNEVMSLVYGKRDYASFIYPYIFIKPDFDCKHLHKYVPDKNKHLKVFGFKDWLELFTNKTEKTLERR